MYDNLETKLEIFNTHKIVMKAMDNTDLFFDRCHPGAKPHKELTERLHKVFQNSVL